MGIDHASAGGSGGGGAVTVADGADVAEGATTDAANTTGAVGTLSGKLRGLVTIFADIWDSVNHRIRVDGSGVTQPVSGSVAVSNFPATQPVSGTVAVSGSVEVTNDVGNPLPVSGTVAVSNFPATQAVSGTVTANQGTANTAANGWPVKPTDGTNSATFKAASTASVATDTSEVVQISPNQPQLTTPLNTQGAKTNNAATPGATNFGVIDAIANEALPSYSEGNLVIPAYDLRGVLRTMGVPISALGFYSWQGITGGYTGLAANTPLWSMRWGDATRLGILLRVEVMVFTSTAATVASITERQLILARGFTASDTGGTSATLTGNNQKMRTSMGTSLLTNLQIGAPLTAGTRTLDAAPISSTMGWSALLNTGTTIGGFGGVSTVTATTSAVAGGGQFQKLWDAINGQEYPIVFAQNEGAVIRIGAVQPTTAVQQTLVRVVWAEANKVY